MIIKENNSKKKESIYKHFSILSIFFISFLLVFLSGAYSNSSKFDISSKYLADVASNHTIDKNRCSFIVESKNYAKHSLISTDIEYKNLKFFGKSNVGCYFGAVNADKQHKIFMKGVSENNLSFLYVQKGFNNFKSRDTWWHEYYPLQLMFKGEHSVLKGAYSFFYISKTHADKMLDSQRLEHTVDNYKKLLQTNQTIEIDGSSFQWTIANIYLETNGFYNSLKSVMGDFLLGFNKYPNGINKQAIYSMSKYEFQNKYYLKYVTENYSKENYDYKIGTYNLDSDFKIDNRKALSFEESSNNLSFIVLLTFSCLFFISSFILVKKLNYLVFKKNLVLIIAASLSPYILFKIIFHITGNVIFFSSISRLINIILITIIVLCLIICLFHKYLMRKKNR